MTSMYFENHLWLEKLDLHELTSGPTANICPEGYIEDEGITAWNQERARR
jgi:hypothetical protein